uniref:Uncharacterized protein n=1 Tax=Anopheles atroparvus TaxID=41427 RepID=A0A182JN19_ANOAO
MDDYRLTDGRLLSPLSRRSQVFLCISRNSAVIGGRVTTPTLVPPPPGTPPTPPPLPLVTPVAPLLPLLPPPAPPPPAGAVELLLLAEPGSIPGLRSSPLASHTHDAHDHRLSPPMMLLQTTTHKRCTALFIH